MSRDLAHHVKPVLQPRELGARGRWEDRGLAILALEAVLRYVLAVVSETSWRVVW